MSLECVSSHSADESAVGRRSRKPNVPPPALQMTQSSFSILLTRGNDADHFDRETHGIDLGGHCHFRQRGQQRQRVSPTEPTIEVSFSLTRLPENQKQYSLVVSDSNERVVSGIFSIDQLQVLRAIIGRGGEVRLDRRGSGHEGSHHHSLRR